MTNETHMAHVSHKCHTSRMSHVCQTRVTRHAGDTLSTLREASEKTNTDQIHLILGHGISVGGGGGGGALTGVVWCVV